MEKSKQNKSREEIERLVNSVVDVMELTFLSEPVRMTTHYLCELARHKVLAKSVKAANVNTVIGQMLRGIWLTDIDSKQGRPVLKGAIKNLPTALFLRTSLIGHILTRVYWSHWKRQDRLALLDAGEDLLAPIRLKIDKPRLKRLIEKSGKRSGRA